MASVPLHIPEVILENSNGIAQSVRVLELRANHGERRLVLARKDGVCRSCAHVHGIAWLGMNGIENRLCLREIASQLKADRKKTDDRRIFRTKIAGSPEMFLGRRDIPSRQVSYRGIYQQKNVLWIEFDRLRVKLSALFPVSLPARHTAEIFRGYSVVWILSANPFE